MAFSSTAASVGSGYVVKPDITTCETITIKSAMVMFPSKNTRLVVKAAEEDKSIKPKRAARGKKLNMKQKVLADESNDIRDLIKEAKGKKHNMKHKVKVLADELNDIRDLINRTNMHMSDIRKIITEYLKDMRDMSMSSKRIEEIRILSQDTSTMPYRTRGYHKMLCDEIKAKYGLMSWQELNAKYGL